MNPAEAEDSSYRRDLLASTSTNPVRGKGLALLLVCGHRDRAARVWMREPLDDLSLAGHSSVLLWKASQTGNHSTLAGPLHTSVTAQS